MAKAVERLQADQVAAVVRAAQPALMRLAQRLCATPADARDLVQDALERAVSRGIPADVANPCAWLTKIVSNVFVDRCRAAARRPVHEPFDDGVTACPPHGAAPEPAWANVTSEDLVRAVRQLEPIYRRAYELRMFEQLSYAEIAQREGVSPIAVGTRLNRAREKLRDLLVAQQTEKP